MEKLFSDSFLKIQNWAYLWINNLKFYKFVFIVCQVEGYQNILKLSCKLLAFTLIKAFLKTKKGLETSLPDYAFSASILKKKYLSCYILLTEQISLNGELLSNKCVVIVFLISLRRLPRSDAIRRDMRVASFWCFYFTRFSGVSVVDLEQVNAG